MSRRKKLFLPLLLCLALLLTACGAGNDPDATATEPSPAATAFPTFAYLEPTKPTAFDDAAAANPEPSSVQAAALDAKLVERGRGRYTALGCDTCHGDAGEGSAEGKRLTAFSMSEEDFITFMRSGGELGTIHQFSTDRLSNSGSRNLYQYLLSLAQGA